MIDFFGALYEWFGTNPFYSRDLGELLMGWDITCTDYIGTPWYLIIGWVMIGSTALIYGLHYHIIDSPKWYKKQYWWWTALVIISLNFLVAFLISFNIVQSSDYCEQLNLTIGDCAGFGLSNAIWSLILFVLITTISYPRKLSTNNRHTTFWKP